MALIGKLTDDVVIFEKLAIEELYNRSFYGRPKGDTLEISLTESAYLIYMGKIIVEYKGKYLDFKDFFLKASSLLKNFELYYIVYKDLRERGYYIQPAVTGFRVYPRGGHPGKTPAEFFMYVTSERIPLLLSAIITHLGTVENLKKRLVLAIVDEDSDLTYYEVKKTLPTGTYKSGSEKKLSTASLLEDRVMVWDPQVSAALQRQGFFGRPMDEGHLQLSLVESCYLLKNGVLEIEDRDKVKLDYTNFSTMASKIESNFMVKYVVYENLRNSGLVPKTGFKFGTHFRVYKKMEAYLSSWDNIPGNDNDNRRLIEFLAQKFCIDWVKTAKIEKIDDGRTIRLTEKNNVLSLRLNDEKTKVNLEINDSKTDEFIVKIENDKLNIYIKDMAKLPHSDYLIHAIEHDHIFSLQQLSRAVRLANSVRKDMIYGAVVDSHVQFFIVGRMRL